ncbi:MAG TPA: glycosyltransferase family 4 protein [Terriglobia bacterium]|jgi:glycosyltransferase involved in cell wall biosynthesis|nr:glycosyltransferase family 4 protein [Terriglobia bacterium]
MPKALTICHFSSVHSTLKSRSFHMECMPLAQQGFHVRFVAPAGVNGIHGGVEFFATRRVENLLLRILLNPAFLYKVLCLDADIYHFQDPELIPLALIAKLVLRKRMVYDAFEDFPSMVRNSNRVPGVLQPVVMALISTFEHLAARIFDGVMTADPFTLRRLARTGKSRKLVFFNFPNLNLFPQPDGSRRPYDFVYRGGLSERTGTMLLLEALRIMADRGKQARLLLMGYSDSELAEKNLRDKIRALGLESMVEMRGRIKHEEMAAALGQARIGVSPLQANPKFLLNLPVKIFEYWACGLPVIASDLPPIRPFFRDRQFGLLVKPGDARALADALNWMLDHPAEAARMGEEGRRAVVQRYNNGKEIRKLSLFLRRIAAQ